MLFSVYELPKIIHQNSIFELGIFELYNKDNNSALDFKLVKTFFFPSHTVASLQLVKNVKCLKKGNFGII
jgi:hypothetical protein